MSHQLRLRLHLFALLRCASARPMTPLILNAPCTSATSPESSDFTLHVAHVDARLIKTHPISPPKKLFGFFKL